MEMIKPTYDFNEIPNSLLLQEGSVSIEIDGKKYDGDCEINLEFTPYAKISMYTSFPDISEYDAWGFFDRRGKTFLTIGSEKVECLLVSLGSKGFTFKWIPRFSPLRIFKNQNVPLSHLDFHLFNFINLLGARTSIEKDDLKGQRIEHLDLKFNDWEVEIKSLTSTRDSFSKLSTEGGYQLTHVGRIQRIENKSFSEKDSSNILEALRFFLSFAKGESCQPVFVSGFDSDNKLTLETYSAPEHSSGKVSSWFDSHTGSQLVELFPGFMTKWEDSEWRQAIKEVLYWYLNAIDPNSTTSAHVILVQAGIERLSYEFSVKDRKLITAQGFKKLMASDKMRLLFSSLQIPLTIPEETPKIKSLAHRYNWLDSPHALTEIRNSLVHPEHKRKADLISVHHEGHKLSLWYLELAILAICGYKHTYSNRLTQRYAGQTEYVPWVDKVAPKSSVTIEDLKD